MLYRKYRGQKLADIIGQDHITKSLKQAVEKDRIAHAYLFAGPRGVGKTSVARILVHLVNDLAYSGQVEHLDIIEIDAASNRRIDEIRDLRDKIHIAPTSAKYKVYIIDEVHMLTKEAFNALLKTLEEPPAHAIFILATTEPHKLPPTIISRTQRHNFKTIGHKDLIKGLKQIAKQESVTVDEDVLELIAEHSDGSFRDAISIFEQITSDKKLDIEAAREILGVAKNEVISQLLIACFSGKTSEIYKLLDELYNFGSTAPVISSQLISELRNLIRQEPDSAKEYLSLIEELLHVPQSADPRTRLEASLVGCSLDNMTVTPKAKDFDESDWTVIIKAVKEKSPTLYAVLRMAQADLDKSKLTLTFKFPFHQKKLQSNVNMDLLTEVASAALDRDIRVATKVDPKLKGGLDGVLNTFGGGEVVDYE